MTSTEAPKLKLGKRTTAEGITLYYKTDLTGKNVIITGGNSGIGKETARVMSKAGATVFLPCRDQKKADEAAEEVKNLSKNDKVFGMVLDLTSLESIRNFANEFNSKNIPLHILFNNAGVMATPYSKTKDGFEFQFGINHLGHFLLTNLLLDRLKQGTPSRVVCVSSDAYKMGKMTWDDLQSEKSYGKWKAYGRSKLANMLFAKELNRRLQGTGVTAYSVHPGVIHTGLMRHNSSIDPLWKAVSKPFVKSIPQGAATSVYCGVAPNIEESGGSFYSDCKLTIPSNSDYTDENAKTLWDVSVKLVGLETSENTTPTSSS